MEYIKDIEGAFDFIRKEIKKKDDLCDALKVSKEVMKYSEKDEYSDNVYKQYWDIEKVFSYCRSCETIEKVIDEAKLSIDQAVDNLTKIQENNKIVTENNNKIFENIKQIMKQYGINETFYAIDPKSKARWPKQITQEAGYISDLRRTIPLRCPIEARIKKFKDLKKNLIDRANSLSNEIIIKNNEIKAQVAEEEKIKLIATLKIKYDLDFKLDERAVLLDLLSRNKYLNLAYSMLLTRGDWGDGFWRVDDALNSFTVLNDEDREIEKEISSLLDQDDGRVFRDCKYNYDYLFELAAKNDKQLYDDYSKLMEYVRE